MLIMKIIGFSLCVLGVVLMWLQIRAISGEEITEGKVIDLIPVQGSKGGTNYKVKAEFSDTAKVRHEYLSSWSASPAPYAVGETVRIAFDRGNPERNRLFTFGARFGPGWILLGIGLVLIWITFGFGYGNEYLLRRYPDTY
jgi:hypothetical protein